MEHISSNTRWDRALGTMRMANPVLRDGWTGADIKEFVEDIKRDGFEALDEFAGGELAKLKGTPLYPMLLEVTAIRYAVEVGTRSRRERAA